MAKKFRFKLAPVLKYRETIEEERRTRYLQIQQLRDQKLNELVKLRAESTKAVESMVDAQTGSMDISRVRLLNRYMTGLNISTQQNSAQLRSIEGEAEKRRQELVLARKDVKVMEKLREKQLDEHEYEERREETKAFDEIASQAHRRRELEARRLAEEASGEAQASSPAVAMLHSQQLAQAAYGAQQRHHEG